MSDPLNPVPLHDTSVRGFSSDNYAGAHPEVLAAVTAANEGHQPSYGADAYTARLREVVARHFGERAEVHPVFTGTGANVNALMAMLPRWAGVVCAATAHINTDENGAPERVGGIKLLPVETLDGKLTPRLLERAAGGRGDAHRAQPLAVSVTQATELGTCYTPEELRALCEAAHGLGMRVHLDGARLPNAAVHLGVPLAALTTDVGVDALSLGGTKSGLLGAEAVVVLDPDAACGLDYLRKSTAQLASKMRFLSAQLVALYDGDLWRRTAHHANTMAAHLRYELDAAIADGLAPGLAFTQPTEANALFATLPEGVAERIRSRFPFYDWDAERREVRWMCSWDTQEAEVDAFVRAILDSLPR